MYGAPYGPDECEREKENGLSSSVYGNQTLARQPSHPIKIPVDRCPLPRFEYIFPKLLRVACSLSCG